MTEEIKYRISVESVAHIIRDMNAEEKAYLLYLVPESREVEPLKPPEQPLRPSEEFLEQLRQEILEARGGVPPSDDEPFIGGLTRGEFYRLPEEEQEAIWDKVWAQAEAEVEKSTEADYREHPVKLDALIAGQERNPCRLWRPAPGEGRGAQI